MSCISSEPEYETRIISLQGLEANDPELADEPRHCYENVESGRQDAGVAQASIGAPQITADESEEPKTAAPSPARDSIERDVVNNASAEVNGAILDDAGSLPPPQAASIATRPSSHRQTDDHQSADNGAAIEQQVRTTYPIPTADIVKRPAFKLAEFSGSQSTNAGHDSYDFALSNHPTSTTTEGQSVLQKDPVTHLSAATSHFYHGVRPAPPKSAVESSPKTADNKFATRPQVATRREAYELRAAGVQGPIVLTSTADVRKNPVIAPNAANHDVQSTQAFLRKFSNEAKVEPDIPADAEDAVDIKVDVPQGRNKANEEAVADDGQKAGAIETKVSSPAICTHRENAEHKIAHLRATMRALEGRNSIVAAPAALVSNQTSSSATAETQVRGLGLPQAPAVSTLSEPPVVATALTLPAVNDQDRRIAQALRGAEYQLTLRGPAATHAMVESVAGYCARQFYLATGLIMIRDRAALRKLRGACREAHCQLWGKFGVDVWHIEVKSFFQGQHLDVVVTREIFWTICIELLSDEEQRRVRKATGWTKIGGSGENAPPQRGRKSAQDDASRDVNRASLDGVHEQQKKQNEEDGAEAKEKLLQERKQASTRVAEWRKQIPSTSTKPRDDPTTRRIEAWMQVMSDELALSPTPSQPSTSSSGSIGNHPHPPKSLSESEDSGEFGVIETAHDADQPPPSSSQLKFLFSRSRSRPRKRKCMCPPAIQPLDTIAEMAESERSVAAVVGGHDPRPSVDSVQPVWVNGRAHTVTMRAGGESRGERALRAIRNPPERSYTGNKEKAMRVLGIAL